MARRFRSALVVLALAAFLAAGANRAVAEERGAWDGGEAAKALRAAKQGERAGLLAKARADGLDPWVLFAHVRAEGDASEFGPLIVKAFADVAPRLGAYVETAAAGDAEPTWIRAVDRAREALEEGELDDAEAALQAASIRARPATVEFAAARYLEAVVRSQRAQLDRCVEAALVAGSTAAEIGWLGCSERAFRLATRMATAAGLLEPAREALAGLLHVHEQREDAPAVATTHLDLAGLDLRRGDLPRSLRDFEEALALFESLGDSAGVVKALSLRIGVYGQLGDYRRALDAVRELHAREDEFPDPARLSDFLTNAAVVHHGVGDAEKARDLLERSLSVALGGNDALTEAMARGNMGLVHQANGDWDAALASYRRVADIAKREGHMFQALVANLNMAEALRQRAEENAWAARVLEGGARKEKLEAVQEDCRLGLKLIDEGLPVMQSVGAAGVAASMAETRCQLRRVLGDDDTLRASFEGVIEECRRLRKWGTQLSATLGLARLLIAAKDWDAALHVSREGVDRLADGYAGLGDLDLARARSGHADLVDLGVRAATELDRPADVLHLLEQGRAGALLRGMGGRSAVLRATVSGSLRESLAARVRAKARAMAALHKTRRRGDARALPGARAAYEQAQQDELAVREAIEAHERKQAARLIPAQAETLRGVQGALATMARRSGVVRYVAFNLQARAAFALVVSAQGKPRLVRYKPDQVAGIHAALAVLREDAWGEFEGGVLADLRKSLIEPLGLENDTEVLMVAPDGELAYVPFRTLMPDGMSVALVPSATVMRQLLADGMRRGSARLALGDPDYDQVSDRGAFQRRGGSELLRLPSTRATVEAIATGKRDVKLLGTSASLQGLLGAFRDEKAPDRWRVVHLGCHGHVDVEWPSLCSLALTPSEGHDGFVTVPEILRLPLKADLVVLSACQTGRGRFIRGEGIMGLSRALMHAGAPRVVASLWKVEDEASGALMRAFHKHLDAGLGTADALRKAQLEIRDTVVETKGADGKTVKTTPWKDPSFWAAWVLWGLPD